jgi:hypothetical protein
MEGSREYIEEAVTASRQGVVLQLGGWAEWLTTPTVKPLISYEPYHSVSGNNTKQIKIGSTKRLTAE